ncbi:CPBP family intramembrane metalloprotease domain-containing protein [Spongiactinospora gelatinilytica]|uniref:CPBP family intramembrane metalloprotease domain-containing protein n=1 Tax=Spongiactinospora gelatinilytica TaxID=2666298 RepID=A0A2W2HXH0_9ACTN|nr:type II CAAX endopeptidase family protein [Spongiactinospora gelatinilytica]PZG55350.1 CPBP family intramembrane metalloprotease domain-containing protein [Spongiactinospora gelatinilytica]
MVTDRLADVDRQSAGGLTGFIRRRPLLSFFILANTLSWLAWIPYILSGTGLGVWEWSFPAVLGTTQILGMLPGAYLGPIVSAYLVTRIADGRPGVRRWTARLWKWRVSWRWYLGVLVGVPGALTVTSLAISGGQIQAPPAQVLVLYLPLMLLQFITTGIAEEPGWRDFALPRLQAKYGPVVATLILGPLWGVWHLPLFLSEWGGWPDVQPLTVVQFVASCVTLSIVMTWVFNRTGESLPLAIILHIGINTFFSLAFESMFPTIGSHAGSMPVQLLATTTLAVVLLVATRGRLGYRPRLEAV